MGFKRAKQNFLEAFRDGRVVHETRASQAEKNWVSSGEVSLERAHEILSCARGQDGRSDRHDLDDSLEVWIFKPLWQAQRWYVKGFLLDGEIHLVELHLISFHPSEGGPS